MPDQPKPGTEPKFVDLGYQTDDKPVGKIDRNAVSAGMNLEKVLAGRSFNRFHASKIQPKLADPGVGGSLEFYVEGGIVGKKPEDTQGSILIRREATVRENDVEFNPDFASRILGIPSQRYISIYYDLGDDNAVELFRFERGFFYESSERKEIAKEELRGISSVIIKDKFKFDGELLWEDDGGEPHSYEFRFRGIDPSYIHVINREACEKYGFKVLLGYANARLAASEKDKAETAIEGSEDWKGLISDDDLKATEDKPVPEVKSPDKELKGVVDYDKIERETAEKSEGRKRLVKRIGLGAVGAAVIGLLSWGALVGVKQWKSYSDSNSFSAGKVDILYGNNTDALIEFSEDQTLEPDFIKYGLQIFSRSQSYIDEIMAKGVIVTNTGRHVEVRSLDEDKVGKVVGGAGFVEVEVVRGLRKFANSLSGREQLAVLAFADSLEAIPITLAENAGLERKVEETKREEKVAVKVADTPKLDCASASKYGFEQSTPAKKATRDKYSMFKYKGPGKDGAAKGNEKLDDLVCAFNNTNDKYLASRNNLVGYDGKPATEVKKGQKYFVMIPKPAEAVAETPKLEKKVQEKSRLLPRKETKKVETEEQDVPLDDLRPGYPIRNDWKNPKDWPKKLQDAIIAYATEGYKRFGKGVKGCLGVRFVVNDYGAIVDPEAVDNKLVGENSERFSKLFIAGLRVPGRPIKVTALSGERRFNYGEGCKQ